MKSKLVMNSKLVNRLILGLIALLLIGCLAATNEIITLLGKNDNQLVSLKAEHEALNQEQTYLASAKQEVKKYSPLQQIAETVVPQDKNQAQAVREIVNLAQANGISLSSITFPSSTLGSTAGGPPSSAATLSLSQLTAVSGIPGVYVLPIHVTASSLPVSYSSFISFLTALEKNRRTSIITGLGIQPQQGGLINFNLVVNEYIKPQ